MSTLPLAYDGPTLAPLLSRIPPHYDGHVLLHGEGVALLDAPAEPGWTAGPRAGHWRTHHQGATAVHLVDVHAAVAEPRAPLWEAPEPGPIAPWLVPRLLRFRDVAGVDYRGTPGTTGHAMIRHHATGAPRWHAPTPDPRVNDSTELDYTRTNWPGHDTPHGHGAGTYDMNLAYLAAAAAVHLAGNPLARSGRRREPAENIAGWWLIDAAPWGSDGQIPHPAGPGYQAHEPFWVTTPTVLLLQQLTEHGVYGGFGILDAWTAPGRRILRPWAETIRDGIYNAPEPTAKTLKHVYRESVGLMARPGGRIHRPDWRAAIIAQSRATLWRRAWTVGNKTGHWPLRIHVDALTYDRGRNTTAEHALTLGLPIRPGLGGWKLADH